MINLVYYISENDNCKPVHNIKVYFEWTRTTPKIVTICERESFKFKWSEYIPLCKDPFRSSQFIKEEMMLSMEKRNYRV